MLSWGFSVFYAFVCVLRYEINMVVVEWCWWSGGGDDDDECRTRPY